MFSVSEPTWGDRSCPRRITEDPDFIVDGNELVLLDGNPNTCLSPLTFERSSVRINAYVYAPTTNEFLLQTTVTNLRCESPALLTYCEQKCEGADTGTLLQCRLHGSNPTGVQDSVISCTFACTTPFSFQQKTRVVIQIETLPWEMKHSMRPQLCGLTTII